jgi:monooxygenase
MSERFDAVVVGGGMGGLALGLMLGRQGRSVAVIERQAGIKPLRRGELLQPNGLRILDRMGVLDGLKSLPTYTAYRYHFMRIGRGRLCTVDYRMLPPPWNYTLALEPHYLLGHLVREIGRSENVALLSGTEFKSCLIKNGKIIGIKASKYEKELEVYSPLVVGSDGARSRVREAVGIRADVHVYREAYLTMMMPLPQGFNEEARYYVGRGEILGLFPLSDEKLYLFYMIRANELEAMKQRSLDHLKKRLVRVDSSLEEPLGSVRSWDDVGYMPCVRVRADRWAGNGVVLMGDAAHAMNPHVAQGRNQALEDAAVLSETIEEAFKKNDFSSGRFKAYESNRRPVVEAYQRQGDEMVLFWNTGFTPAMWMRDRVFKRLDRDKRLRYKMLSLISGRSDARFSFADKLAAAGMVPIWYND